MFSKLLYLLGLLVELLVLVNGYSHLRLAGVLVYLILGLLFMRNYVSFALLFIVSAIIALYEYLTTLNFMFVVLFVLFVVAFITCFIKSGMKKYKKYEKVKRYDKINTEKSAKINAEKFTEDFTVTDSHKSHDSHKSEKIYEAETPTISTYGGDNAEEKFAEAVNVLNKISDDSDKNALESKKKNVETSSGKTLKKTFRKPAKNISKKKSNKKQKRKFNRKQNKRTNKKLNKRKNRR